MININFLQLKSALVTTVLMAIATIAVYIIGVGDIFTIDWKVAINLGVMSLLAGIVSLIKSLLTTDSGNFVGIVKVK